MSRNKYFLTVALLGIAGALSCPMLMAAEMSADDAWQALPKYEYGQDMAPLLKIDRVVSESMRTPATRATCAKRLAGVLTMSGATMAARQYACLQLRTVGTSAEVPVLAKLLAEPATSQMARYALECIAGPESRAALRNGLTTTTGSALIGVVNSVAARRDSMSVPILKQMVDSPDKKLGAAALWALGNIADEPAVVFIEQRAADSGIPTPRELTVPLLRCAAVSLHNGNGDRAQAIFTKLSQSRQLPAVRRAALEGLFGAQGTRAATVIAWLASEDGERRQVAMGHLHALSDEQLDELLARVAELPSTGQMAVIDLGIARHGDKMFPLAQMLAKSTDPAVRLAGVRCMGRIGDARVIPILIDALEAGGDLTAAAQDALVNLPRKQVIPPMLDALNDRVALRRAVIATLVKMKCYEAIDPLIRIAAQDDPSQYGPALDGLRGIADPDKTDIPRLVKLLSTTERGQHADEVEKTILVVCDRLSSNTDHAKPVLDALAQVDPTEMPKYLPLLGRLGGPKALAIIQDALAAKDPKVQAAAVRALCNWPNAEVADQLLDRAKNSESRTYRRWALRAYVRVVTLKSDRSDAATLAMLKTAMKLASGIDEKRLVLERTATIRTMDAVNWLASYLDDPELAQVACAAIVELARHRFLRNPNMDRFGPILERIVAASKDPEIVARAKRYRLGL